jgi:hypothetical protein
MKMSKNVDRMLKDGESVVATLQGNSYTTDSNPVTRMVASVVRIVNVILGAPTRTTIICTNKRLIIENAQKILWVLDYSADIDAVAPRGIMTTGYNFVRSWYIFKNHYLTVSVSGSGKLVILSKDGMDGVMKMLDAVESLREKVS